MKWRCLYILPSAYVILFVIKTLANALFALKDGGESILFDMIALISLTISSLVETPAGVILTLLGIPLGIVSVALTSLILYSLLGGLLDMYDTLPWRQRQRSDPSK
jgi:hypothetical protein